MTKNWNDLPDEMKEMVVDNMDIVTRFRLKMCSKSDKRLVESIQFYCDEVKVQEKSSSNLQFRISHAGFSCEVKMFDSNVRVLNLRSGEIRCIPTSSEDEAVETIKSMFFAFILTKNVRISRFSVDLDPDVLFPSLDVKLHVKHLDVGKDAEKWLDMVDSKIQGLTIRNKINGLGKHQVVKSVNCLQVYKKNNIDDEQLIGLKATKLEISYSKITDKGVNQFIKKMIDEDYPIGSSMKFIHNTFNWDKLIDGLNTEVIDNDNNDDADNFRYDTVFDEDLDYDDENEEVDCNIARVTMSAKKDIIITLPMTRRHQHRGNLHLEVVKR